jgi:hypothetical protein
MSRLILPGYFLLVKCVGNHWTFCGSKIFYNPHPDFNPPTNDRKEEYYGTTKHEVILNLFRQYLGKQGYYLVDLRDRKYYYCGLTIDDVKEKLSNLRIGYAKERFFY